MRPMVLQEVKSLSQQIANTQDVKRQKNWHRGMSRVRFGGMYQLREQRRLIPI